MLSRYVYKPRYAEILHDSFWCFADCFMVVRTEFVFWKNIKIVALNARIRRARVAHNVFLHAYMYERARIRRVGILYIKERRWWMRSSVEQPRGNVSRSVIYGRTVKPAPRPLLREQIWKSDLVFSLFPSFTCIRVYIVSALRNLTTLQKDHQIARWITGGNVAAKHSVIFVGEAE